MITFETPVEIALEAAVRFKKFRKNRGMTIKEISGRSGVPYSTVRRFEASGEISFVSLIKLTSVLGEDEQIRNLFRDIPPRTMEEVLNGEY